MQLEHEKLLKNLLGNLSILIIGYGVFLIYVLVIQR